MRDSMYSAMFGAMSNDIRMDTIANNLANVNTTAYKKDTVAFHDTFQRFAHDYLVDSKPYLRDKEMWPKPDVIAKPRLSDQVIDFSQGNLQETGNPLDFALNGEGFFRVRTPDGDFLTRNGSFSLNTEGDIVTEQGFQVLGDGGPINVSGAEQVRVDPTGAIRVGEEIVGQFELVAVSDVRGIKKAGNNLYEVDPNSLAEEVPPDGLSVQQGYVEKGNVNVVTEMVQMIETQRSFQMYTKMMQGTTQLDTKLINTVGRVT